MVVDTSALVAILKGEEDADDFNRRLLDGFPRRISAANYLELSIVMCSGGNADGLRWVDTFLERAEVEIVPVTQRDALLAREAFLRFGKGRSPAGLNFGDCFSYALARRLNESLLFKGADFSKTDIEAA